MTIKTTNQGSTVRTYNSAEEKLIKIILMIKLTKTKTNLLAPKIFVLASNAKMIRKTNKKLKTGIKKSNPEVFSTILIFD